GARSTYAAATERTRYGRVSVAALDTGAGPWRRYAGGAARTTRFGYETISASSGMAEESLTVKAHHGLRVWRGLALSPGLEPRLEPSGVVRFFARGVDTGLAISRVEIFDRDGAAITPSGIGWSMKRAATGWLLALRLDDTHLPLPYTIDPAVTTVAF